MAPPHASSSLGYGRLARRLIVLFVAVSLVPLIASDWLAMYATRDVNRNLQERVESQRVRLVGRQVFDKLLNAELLLGSFPANSVEGAKLPGVGVVFSSASFAGSQAPQTALLAAWNAAGVGASLPARIAPSPTDIDVDIRVLRGDSQPRILMARLLDENLVWIAEVDRAYLWSPVVDASEENAWTVIDAAGAPVFASSPTETAHGFTVQSRIFLGAEFDTVDWIFQSNVASPTVMWQGLPVAVWLALVATATLLIIALFSLWRIREALAPLTALTQSTRLLGQGRKPLRLDVKRDDEIGDLASAFNDMSARIASQFATLSELAAIDQDILKGASIRALAERAADQLASGSAHARRASVTIEWMEPDGNLHSVTRNEGVAESDIRPAASDAAHLSRFVSLGERAALHNGVVSDSHGDASQASVPIVLNGTTRAAIVWRSPQLIDSETLLASFNLRDRLAVAFAARDRETELVHLATHDTLTGLASRYRLHQALEEVTAGSSTSSLLFIDLDHFKDVNDSRGHQAGDELLCRIAERLQTCCPDGAVLARQGGDEFALVLIGLDSSAASALAGRILATVKRPVMLESGPCTVSASIGIAEFQKHATTREGLLRCADVALYSAKAVGRNAYRVFDMALDVAEQTRVHLAADIRGAAARGELELHYQARVRPDDLKIAGAEALVRWHHPTRGLIGPDDFIHISEETGAIHEIGDWVIDSAAAQVGYWRRSMGTSVRVSVNISPKQFESGLLVDQIDRAVARHNIPHDALEVEVTENVLVGDTASAFAQLAELRARGVRIALDDFGTGYSSMALLSSLPFDIIKIDRSFVERLSRNDRVRHIVRAIASMGLSANLMLVAEGIETAEQAAELTALGCHELQGFLFGRPMPADLFARGPLTRR